MDLKADRSAGLLLVPGAFLEEGQDVGRVAAELARTLRDLASWLGLRDVVTGDRGALSQPLAAALARL
ncbi:hypothetical protein [Amycolatopsis acidiphila]|uniref:Uncharacterized protein n=1 Tax=Amycolatopsis acidiphila TaxID=715473 RepID=A0A558A6V5_9PSEU|nr:hypothetical protein FNH06_22035 [Amycolatopsis acidiphila]GHG68768.1 hypothetical protein GCM10017788_28810 [Amycolatopsis acidiphila]